MQKVAFLGTGLMGFNMARRLAEKGFTVMAWNRTYSKAKPLESYGVKVVEDLPRAVKEAEVISVMVSDDSASETVLREAFKHANEGAVILNHSTVTPMHSSKMYLSARERGLSYIALPVMGGPADALRGELVGIAGGDVEVLSRIEGYQESLFKKVFYLGSVEEASAVKLALNSIYFSAMIGLAEALVLVEAWGVTPQKFFEVTSELWIKPIVERYGSRLLAENYPVSFKLRLAAKDASYALSSGLEKGFPLPHIATMAQTLLIASQSGKLGEEDYTRIYRFLKGLR